MGWVRDLLILFFCLVTGIFVTGLIQSVLLNWGILEPISIHGSPTSANNVRVLLLLNQVGTFLVPSVLYIFLIRRLSPDAGHLSAANADWQYLLPSLLCLLLSLPLIQWMHEFNQTLPLPDWMRSRERDTEAILEQILAMGQIRDLLLNLVVMAAIPAIAEEFFFRGIIQQRLVSYTGRPWLGILLAAGIFSAIHFQFEGFLPRWLLGIFLGTAYAVSRTIWLPVALHFLFNGVQVVLHYAFTRGWTELDTQAETTDIHWSLTLLAGAVFLAYLAWGYARIKRTDYNHPSNPDDEGTTDER